MDFSFKAGLLINPTTSMLVPFNIIQEERAAAFAKLLIGSLLSCPFHILVYPFTLVIGMQICVVTLGN